MFLSYFKKDSPALKARKIIKVICWVAILYIIANFTVIGAIWCLGYFKVQINTHNLILIQFLHVAVYMVITALFFTLMAYFDHLKLTWHKMLKFKFSDLAFSGWLKWSDIGLALIGYIVAVILQVIFVIIIQSISSSFNPTQVQELGFTFGLHNSRLELLVTFISLVMFIPIVEEIVFRGYLFSKIREISSFLTTTIIVSVIFGICHFPGGGAVAAISTFALSLVMCLTREMVGSIYPSILMHMINNGLAFFALLSVVNLSTL